MEYRSFSSDDPSRLSALAQRPDNSPVERNAPTLDSSAGICHSSFVISPSSSHARAFTLLELLVVIAVVGVLASLLLPVLGRGKEAGRSAACVSNLRQMGVALQLYLQDNQNRFPFMFDAPPMTNSIIVSNAFATIDRVLSNYLGAPKIFFCPSDDQDLFTRTGSSYAWNFLLNGQLAEQVELFRRPVDSHETPLVLDKEPFHRARGPGHGVNYLYADGHIQNLLVLEGSRPR